MSTLMLRTFWQGSPRWRRTLHHRGLRKLALNSRQPGGARKMLKNRQKKPSFIAAITAIAESCVPVSVVQQECPETPVCCCCCFCQRLTEVPVYVHKCPRINCANPWQNTWESRLPASPPPPRRSTSGWTEDLSSRSLNLGSSSSVFTSSSFNFSTCSRWGSR